MANVLHRTTLEFRRSVNTPDFPPSEWIINPDMSAVQGVPRKHWKVVLDSVLEMTPAEKAVVDQAEDDRRRDQVADGIDNAANELGGQYRRAFAEILIDEFNRRADKVNEILTEAQAANNFADFKSRMAAITPLPQRTLAQLKTALRVKVP